MNAHRRLGRAALVVALAAAGCMSTPQSPTPPGANTVADAAPPCVATQPACPIAVSLASDRGAAPQVLRGALTRASPLRVYRFCIAGAASLRWNWQGAAVRLVLEDPHGDVQGPGLPDPVRLDASGCYRFSISANTMADDAFGDYALSLALEP